MKPQSFIPINKKTIISARGEPVEPFERSYPSTSSGRAGYLCLLILFSQPICPAIFTVTNTADSGAGSLRQAIINSNGTAGPNTINFAIPGAGPFTIAPLTDLPNITNPVTINGYSQPGSSVNTLAVGDNAVLKIILNGASDAIADGITYGNGLYFDTGSDGSVVRGLVINDWLLAGIIVAPTTANVSGIQINGNFIGTDASGTQSIANQIGIGLSGNSFTVLNTVIGTTAVADRNIIGGNFAAISFNNYFIFGAAISSTLNQGTSIVNNYIGTDTTGTIALGNCQEGIALTLESYSVIGGSSVSARNIISGQQLWGIILANSTNITMEGNYVGTDVSGTIALGNQNTGIYLYGFLSGIQSINNTIINNVVSGNGTGIRIGDITFFTGTNLNTVQGNLVGTDFTGTKPIPNTFWGIIVNDAQNTIGGSASNQFNVISGNTPGGILVYGQPTSENLFSHNFIGTDITGTKILSNFGPGVQIGLYGGLGGAPNNTFN